MDFWGFFRGSENPSVLMRTRIFRFSEKLKKAQITLQISLLTKQTLFIRLFVFCSFAPSPHGYSVSRGVPKIPKKSEFLDSNSIKTARIWWIFDVSFGVLKILVY